MVKLAGSLTLSINWKLTILGLLLFPFLLSLGFWQLQRAGDKQLLMDEIASQRALPPLALENLGNSEGSLTYRPVQARGHFVPGRYFLLDNRVMAGRVGYEVLVPLQARPQQWLLVNLGWVEAPALRSQLPRVDLPAGMLTLDGTLAEPSLNRLASETGKGDGWPRRIQQIELKSLSQQLGHTLEPWVLRINPENEHALHVDWREINASPARHQGYAMQWFAMAAALLVLLVFANTNPGSKLKSGSAD